MREVPELAPAGMPPYRSGFLYNSPSDHPVDRMIRQLRFENRVNQMMGETANAGARVDSWQTWLFPGKKRWWARNRKPTEARTRIRPHLINAHIADLALEVYERQERRHRERIEMVARVHANVRAGFVEYEPADLVKGLPSDIEMLAGETRADTEAQLLKLIDDLADELRQSDMLALPTQARDERLAEARAEFDAILAEGLHAPWAIKKS